MERIDNYLKLPYTIKMVNEDDTFYTEVEELSGCWSEGKTPDEAYRNTKDAMKLWISSAIERGIKVPTPKIEEKEYSGKVILRMPKTLHKHLSEEAEKENTSLNQLMLYLLSSNLSIQVNYNANVAIDKGFTYKQNKKWKIAKDPYNYPSWIQAIPQAIGESKHEEYK